MVVGNDHVHAALRGVGGLLKIRHTAVYRDDERNALRRQCVDRGVVETVALPDAVGDVQLADESARAEVIGKQTRGGDAVHVVIAVNGDVFSRRHGAGEPLHGIDHARQRERVCERFRAAAEKFPRRLRLGKSAQMQNRREQRRTAGGEQRRRDLRAALRHFPVCVFHSVLYLHFLITKKESIL